MYRLSGVGLVLLLLSGMVAGQGAPAVDVQIVKYTGLTEAVDKHRGKVVLVDFWTTLCIPCIKNLPDLVKLQDQYKKDGLVVISVSLDDLKESGETAIRDKVRKLLTDRKTNFAHNLILDESDEYVKKKLRITSVPWVYVFNRQGKWTQLTNENEKEPQVRPEVIEKLVVSFLQQK